MPGPSLLIRENCPIATESNDGLMSAEQVVQLNSGSVGGVTSVAASTGIVCTPNPIIAVGAVALADTAVTPGSYTSANITVDQQGRITAAANGGGYPAPSTTPDAVVMSAIVIDGTIMNTQHLVALSANATLSINSPVSGEVYYFEVTNAGSFDIVWPIEVTWPSGLAPVMTPGGVDCVSLAWNGTSYRGSYTQALA